MSTVLGGGVATETERAQSPKQSYNAQVSSATMVSSPHTRGPEGMAFRLSSSRIRLDARNVRGCAPAWHAVLQGLIRCIVDASGKLKANRRDASSTAS